MLILNVKMIQMLGYVWDLRNARWKYRKKEITELYYYCLYLQRHPSQNRECFHEAIKSKFEMLNNEGCEVYITGDINIDFFR